jgi:hypothetical protein
VPDLHGWAMTVWTCVCGREHAPWWRTTPPPSCPNGWPRGTLNAPVPAGSSLLQAFTFETLMSALGGPLPWP